MIMLRHMPGRILITAATPGELKKSTILWLTQRQNGLAKLIPSHIENGKSMDVESDDRAWHNTIVLSADLFLVPVYIFTFVPEKTQFRD